MPKEKLLNIGFYNDKFVKAAQIKINPNNLAMTRGYAAFDFFRVINGRGFYAERHVARFFNTLKLLRLSIDYSANELTQIIEELLQNTQERNYFIKIYAIPGAIIKVNNKAKLLILAVEMENTPIELFETGISLILKNYQRFLPDAKSTNYLPTVFWQKELCESGASDVLYCHNNQILECSRANVFVIKNGHIFTPSLNVLKGITKSVVTDIIQETSMLLEERAITTHELFSADEVFITSTSKMVMPVIQIDNQVVSNGKPGEITKELIKHFNIRLLTWNETLIADN